MKWQNESEELADYRRAREIGYNQAAMFIGKVMESGSKDRVKLVKDLFDVAFAGFVLHVDPKLDEEDRWM